jgi:hypothetical protein
VSGTARAVLATAILAASCTGDRPIEGGTAGAGHEKPRCEARPGRGVEGFVLVRTRDIDEGAHVAVREEYRDRQGRRLFYLLGLFGEIGEGLPVLEEYELVNGQRGRFLGRGRNWILVYEDRFPCPQVAVVGNGFRRQDFLNLLVEASIIPASEVG